MSSNQLFRLAAKQRRTTSPCRTLPLTKSLHTTHRLASSSSTPPPTQTVNTTNPKDKPESAKGSTSTVKAKTVAQLDQELQERLEQMSGGQAGVEYEHGVAAGLKKEVKRNMFRVINMPR